MTMVVVALSFRMIIINRGFKGMVRSRIVSSKKDDHDCYVLNYFIGQMILKYIVGAMRMVKISRKPLVLLPLFTKVCWNGFMSASVCGGGNKFTSMCIFVE